MLSCSRRQTKAAAGDSGPRGVCVTGRGKREREGEGGVTDEAAWRWPKWRRNMLGPHTIN